MITDFDELTFDFNKLIIDPRFDETVREVSELNVSFPGYNTNFRPTLDDLVFESAELVMPIGKINRVALNPKKGTKVSKNSVPICAYDESIIKFQSLEGSAFFTSHSMVVSDKSDYIPVSYITFYFYTRSSEIVKRSKHIRFSYEPEMDSKKDYIKDRIAFLQKAVPRKSILLIDGPLIGGDVYTFMIRSIKKFHEKDVIPIFFVKNSLSNLVTDNVKELRGRYNSDMHWSYNFLDAGQRTSFFTYRDRVNPDNAKVFCYLKGFDLSPQRVEMHIDTFSKYETAMADIMDLVYYLLLVQGNKFNPQVRPIAIAEMYARGTIKLINVHKLIKEVGIMPTMNQTRFGR